MYHSTGTYYLYSTYHNIRIDPKGSGSGCWVLKTVGGIIKVGTMVKLRKQCLEERIPGSRELSVHRYTWASCQISEDPPRRHLLNRETASFVQIESDLIGNCRNIRHPCTRKLIIVDYPRKRNKISSISPFG